MWNFSLLLITANLYQTSKLSCFLFTLRPRQVSVLTPDHFPPPSLPQNCSISNLAFVNCIVQWVSQNPFKALRIWSVSNTLANLLFNLLATTQGQINFPFLKKVCYCKLNLLDQSPVRLVENIYKVLIWQIIVCSNNINTWKLPTKRLITVHLAAVFEITKVGPFQYFSYFVV